MKLKYYISFLLHKLDDFHHKIFHRCWFPIKKLAIYWEHSDCECFKCKNFGGIYYDNYTLDCKIYGTLMYDMYCMRIKKMTKG